MPISGTDSESGQVQLPSSMKPDKTTCSICREESDGFHFGAEACRACAAFFRRSVTSGKAYVCRVDGKCEITANVRCMCRACRYTKCIDVGMNPTGVQQRREILGKRPRTDEQPFDILLPSSQEDEPSNSSPVIPSLETMPMLEKMRQSYNKMDISRAIIHRKEEENLFQPRVPRNITYKESALIVEREVPIICDWVSCCFDEFANLPCDQKQILIQHFLMNFTLLQAAYLCHTHNRDDVIIVASRDYIDINNLQEFYKDENLQKVSSEEAVKLFRQSFEIFRRSLILPMMEEKIDVYEFLALCTCALWEFGLDGQSDECTKTGKQIKEKMLKELSFYLRKVKKIEDPSIRIAMLVTLLPAMNRCVRKFQEDIEISNVFNIYAVPDQYYKIINGKFI